MALDLLVPDLLLPASAPEGMRQMRLPAVERWLARAERVRRPEGDVNALLASAFSLPSPPPVAAITLAVDAGAADGTWMRADPVHLRIEQDAVVLQDAAGLDIGRDEADQLVAALGAHFAEDGLEFHAPVPDRWYVKLPPGEAPQTVALDQAAGRNIFGMLPRGAGAINWPSALTEAQMLLGGHEVNARREAERRPQINSVWFWGEGESPRGLASPYALVYSDDVLASGLAKLTGTRHAPCPAKITELDAVAESQSALVVWDGLRQAVRRGDEEGWKRAATRLEDDWFVELAAALERFEAVRVILPTGRDALVAGLTPAARWRWLRRRQPLSAHA